MAEPLSAAVSTWLGLQVARHVSSDVWARAKRALKDRQEPPAQRLRDAIAIAVQKAIVVRLEAASCDDERALLGQLAGRVEELVQVDRTVHALTSALLTDDLSELRAALRQWSEPLLGRDTPDVARRICDTLPPAVASAWAAVLRDPQHRAAWTDLARVALGGIVAAAESTGEVEARILERLRELQANTDEQRDLIELLLGRSDAARNAAQGLTRRHGRDRDELEDVLHLPGGDVHLARAAAAEVVEGLATGLVVVTGDPGVGKSGVLAQVVALAEEAGYAPVVVSLASLAGVEDIEQALGCAEVTLAEALCEAGGGRPPLLLLDALDALRTSPAKRDASRLVGDLREAGVAVVVTCRTFEAQRSPVWGGTDHFTVTVAMLDDDEWHALRDGSPKLARVLDSLSPSLRDVLRNLFNLRLLAKLLAKPGDAALERLAAVHTELELFDLYWDEVVGESRGRGGDDAGARSQAALCAARAMVQERRLAAPRDAVDGPVDGLLNDGVLLPVGDRALEVRFFHHTFHDYAVMRHLLRLPPDGLIEVMRDRTRLLVVRSAVVRWWRYLLAALTDTFWRRWQTVTRAQARDDPEHRVPTTLRTLAARALVAKADEAKQAAAADLLGPLWTTAWGNEALGAAMRDVFLERSLARGGPSANVLPQDRIWVEWVDRYPLVEGCLWDVLQLLDQATKAHSPLVPDAAATALKVGLAIHERYEGDTAPRAKVWLERATGLIARCAAADLPRAEARLRTVAERPDEKQAQAIANELAELAAADPALAADLVVLLHRADKPPDERVTEGSAVVPLRWSRRDLYGNALFTIARNAAALCQADGAAAVRCAAQVVGDAVGRREAEGRSVSSLAEPLQVHSLGVDWRLLPDYGYFHDVWLDKEAIELAEALIRGLGDLTAEEVERALVEARACFTWAYLWRLVLEAAAAAPESMAARVAFLLAARETWQCATTRDAAGRAAESCWPSLDPEAREAIEGAVLAMDGEVGHPMVGRESRRRDRDRMLLRLGAVGAGLVTGEAHDVQATAEAQSVRPDALVPPFEVLEDDEPTQLGLESPREPAQAEAAESDPLRDAIAVLERAEAEPDAVDAARSTVLATIGAEDQATSVAGGLLLLVDRCPGDQPAVDGLMAMAAGADEHGRFVVARHLGFLRRKSPELAEALLHRFVDTEVATLVLNGVVVSLIETWTQTAPDLCATAAQAILARRCELDDHQDIMTGRYTPGPHGLDGNLGALLATLVFDDGHNGSAELLDEQIAALEQRPATAEALLAAVLHDVANRVEGEDLAGAPARRRATGWTTGALRRLRGIQEAYTAASLAGGKPSEPATATAKAAFELFALVPTCVTAALSNRDVDGTLRQTIAQRLANEGKELVAELCRSREAHTVYSVLELLLVLLPEDPAFALDQAAALLSRAADGRVYLHHVDHLVGNALGKLVDSLLADHTDLLADPNRAAQLAEILEAFVDGGQVWALRVLETLDQVWR